VDSDELRSAIGVLDGYKIMGHYMFFRKDPIWMEMAELLQGRARQVQAGLREPRLA